jgi:hypothetical protein
MQKQIDMIDLVLERALHRPGLIDWTRIDQELLAKGATVQRQVLHKRMKSILAEKARYKFLK